MRGKLVNDSERGSEQFSVAQPGDLPVQAEIASLDRCYFALPEESFNRFVTILDRPEVSNPRLERLLKTRIWF